MISSGAPTIRQITAPTTRRGHDHDSVGVLDLGRSVGRCVQTLDRSAGQVVLDALARVVLFGFSGDGRLAGAADIAPQTGSARFLEPAPPGYVPGWSGSSYLPQAGFGDAIWHTVFGVETSLDALLSPTHLLLFVGLLMIVSAPLWAAWADPTTGPGHRELAPAVASLGLTTTLVAFFFEYA